MTDRKKRFLVLAVSMAIIMVLSQITVGKLRATIKETVLTLEESAELSVSYAEMVEGAIGQTGQCIQEMEKCAKGYVETDEQLNDCVNRLMPLANDLIWCEGENEELRAKGYLEREWPCTDCKEALWDLQEHHEYETGLYEKEVDGLVDLLNEARAEIRHLRTSEPLGCSGGSPIWHYTEWTCILDKNCASCLDMTDGNFDHCITYALFD